MTGEEPNREAILPDDRSESNGSDRRSTAGVATESEPADGRGNASLEDGEEGSPPEDGEDDDANAVFTRLKEKFEESGFESL